MAKKKQPKRWVYSPPKPPKVAVPDDLKAEMERKANELIETVLKPKYIKPPPKNAEFNYLTDFWTKWYRSYFYFCSTYACPGRYAIAPSFESKFARMEYGGSGRFTLSFMRHTGEWVPLYTDQTLDECLQAIRDD